MASASSLSDLYVGGALGFDLVGVLLLFPFAWNLLTANSPRRCPRSSAGRLRSTGSKTWLHKLRLHELGPDKRGPDKRGPDKRGLDKVGLNKRGPDKVEPKNGLITCPQSKDLQPPCRHKLRI